MFYLFNQMLFRIFIYKNLKTKANNNMWPLNREFCQWNNCCLIYNWPVIYFCSKLFYRKNLPPWNAHIYVFLFDCIFSCSMICFCIAFFDVHRLDCRVLSFVSLPLLSSFYFFVLQPMYTVFDCQQQALWFFHLFLSIII